MDLKPLLRKLFPARTLGALRDFLWRLLDIKWTLRSRIPVELHGLSDWVVYSDIFVNREYDDAIDHVYSTLPSGERARILDVGANVGFFALRCLDIAARRGLSWERLDLMLIEGSTPVFEDLTTRMRKWGSAGNVLRVKHGLAGLHEGLGTMEPASLNCMNRVVPGDESGSGRSRVPYVDLRPYFLESRVVHLLKCDIEGSELTFLETYRPQLPVVRSIVIELHHDRCDTRRCVEILEDAGFRNQRTLRETPTFAVAFMWR